MCVAKLLAITGWVAVALIATPATLADTSNNGPRASFPPFSEDSLAPSNAETVSIVDGALEINDPGLSFARFADQLSKASVEAEATFQDDLVEAIFLGLRVQRSNTLSGYLIDVTRNGSLSLVSLLDGEATVLETATADFDPSTTGLQICFSIQQQGLAAWVWPSGEAQPDTPTISTLLPRPIRYREGQSILGARGGAARFVSATFAGTSARPEIIGLIPLRKELRFRLRWQSVAGRVYRIASVAGNGVPCEVG